MPGKKVRRGGKPGGGLATAPQPIVPKLTFSFQFFREREPFVLARSAPGYVSAVFERLRDVCGMEVAAFRTAGGSSLRSHAIDWAATTEPNGFEHLNAAMREQIVPWQFSISANEHGRIHGFLAEQVFYVVWFDPGHELYARK